jgi:hypothetical protein
MARKAPALCECRSTEKGTTEDVYVITGIFRKHGKIGCMCLEQKERK